MTKKKIEQPDLMIRAATVETRAVDGGNETQVRMSVSSEEPVLTYVEINGQYQRAYEILDHSEGAVDMSRCKDGLVVLDRHYGDQVGLMSVELRDGKMGGTVEFCSGTRAQEIGQDATKGLRRNVSVGYVVHPGAYRIEGERDGIPVVRATRWMPYEASFEPVPADTTVGVNRADKTTASETEKPAPQAQKRSSKMSEMKIDAEGVVEVYRLARAFSIEPGAADDHIKSGKDVESFRVMALAKAESDKVQSERKAAELAANKPDAPTQARAIQTVTDPVMDKQIEKRFSVLRVVRHLDAIMRGERSTQDVGFEREISDELAKRSGKPAQGFYIPHNAPVMSGRADPFLKGSNGSAFVATNLLTGSFIDALRSRMVLAAAGVTTLSGLVGDVAIPKGGAIVGGWVDGENGTATEGKPTVSQVTGTPKTASGFCDISRRLMNQSSVDVESFVQNELLNTVARLIEVAAFAGTNANGQPKGLSGWAGLNAPTIGTANAPTRAELLAFVENIMTDNAEFPNQSWIMRPNGWALLKNIPDGIIKNVAGSENVSGFGSGAILKDDNMMLGFMSHVTTNIPAHSLWFGAWSQLVIGLWSGLDLMVDPYSNSTTGATRIVALQDADVMVRHAQAFSYNAALTA